MTEVEVAEFHRFPQVFDSLGQIVHQGVEASRIIIAVGSGTVSRDNGVHHGKGLLLLTQSHVGIGDALVILGIGLELDHFLEIGLGKFLLALLVVDAATAIVVAGNLGVEHDGHRHVLERIDGVGGRLLVQAAQVVASVILRHLGNHFVNLSHGATVVTHLVQDFGLERHVVHVGGVHVQGLIDAGQCLLHLAHVIVAVGDAVVDGLVSIFVVGRVIGLDGLLILVLALIHQADHHVPRGIVGSLHGLHLELRYQHRECRFLH